MRQPRARCLALLALALAGCTGGGSQLARQEQPTASTAAGRVKPIATAKLGGPATANEAAATLTRVERGLRSANRDPARLQRLGRAQQLAYRSIVSHPKWTRTVLRKVGSDVHDAVKANITAGSDLSALTSAAVASPTLPDWQILVPDPATTLRSYYAEAEQAYGIKWAYLAAIHFVESRMGRIHGLSSAGAQGPMQFIPSTWQAYGNGDIYSNHDSILAAAHYLQANNGVADIDSALFRYNNDQRYVAAIKEYASVMLADPNAYDGYYQWQVFYSDADGVFLLPEGWSASATGG